MRHMALTQHYLVYRSSCDDHGYNFSVVWCSGGRDMRDLGNFSFSKDVPFVMVNDTILENVDRIVMSSDPVQKEIPLFIIWDRKVLSDNEVLIKRRI